MPITLITGLPGHGKGVYSLDSVEKLRKASGRPVYYHNIKDLNLQWHELESAKDWVNCPEGSIILLDEAWQTFPLRPNAQTPPDYVAQLATHRHKGFDLFIVTQQPTQLDTFVRKLVDAHYHVVRVFGSQKAHVHQFVGLNADPQKSRKNSIKHVYKYPKEVFTWYKSAEVHTVQTKRPLRIYMLWFGIPIMLVIAIYFANKVLNPHNGDIVNKSKSLTGVGSDGSNVGSGQPRVEPIKPELTYIQAHVSELPDFPHMAPAYRDIVKPVVAPYPAACVQSRSKGCKCYTQQGTFMSVQLSTCRQIVEHGFFLEWRPDTARQESAVRGVSGQSPDVDNSVTMLNRKSSRAGSGGL